MTGKMNWHGALSRKKVNDKARIDPAKVARWPLQDRHYFKPVTYVWGADRDACLKLMEMNDPVGENGEMFVKARRTVRSLMEQSA